MCVKNPLCLHIISSKISISGNSRGGGGGGAGETLVCALIGLQ